MTLHEIRHCPADGEQGPPPPADFELASYHTKSLGARVQAATVGRIIHAEDHPGAPVGQPGERHLVLILDVAATPVGALYGCEAAWVGMCEHGDPPPLLIAGTAGLGRVWHYCHGCGLYMPDDKFPGHRPRPATTALVEQYRTARRTGARVVRL